MIRRHIVREHPNTRRTSDVVTIVCTRWREAGNISQSAIGQPFSHQRRSLRNDNRIATGCAAEAVRYDQIISALVASRQALNKQYIGIGTGEIATVGEVIDIGAIQLPLIIERRVTVDAAGAQLD